MTHDSDNETMANTNNKHARIDEDEPPINEDQTQIEEREWLMQTDEIPIWISHFKHQWKKDKIGFSFHMLSVEEMVLDARRKSLNSFLKSL